MYHIFGFRYCISDRVIIRQSFHLVCHIYSSNIVSMYRVYIDIGFIIFSKQVNIYFIYLSSSSQCGT